MSRMWAVVTAVVVLGGCASIPTSGPVSEVVDDSSLGQSTVRYQPALPADGASAPDIVRGYLDAMLAYPASTQTVTAFLTSDAARSWRAQDGVVVYDGPRVSSIADDAAGADDDGEGDDGEGDTATSVVVTLDEIGRLDPAGRYEVGSGGRALTFTLERVEGQWRISDPPDGLLVTDSFFQDYYRRFDVYYFDRPAERLVAVPVHLQVDDRLAAALIGSLATPPAEEHLRSYLPPLEALRPTVPVSDGVADVGFTAAGSGTVDADRLSAQVVRTLRQVPALSGVRISVGDRQLAPAGSRVQQLTSWQEYDVEDARDRAYGLRDGRVVRLVDDEITPLTGPWGRDAAGARAVAVGVRSLALLDRSRSTVRVVELEGRVLRAVSGQAFLPPVVDADGRFWLVDRPDGEVRLRVVDAGGTITTARTSALKGRDVRSLDVSPDGARYVLGVRSGERSGVWVGAIERSGKDRVLALGRPVELEDAANGWSPVWTDAVRVAFLGRARAGTQVLTAVIDGSATTDGGGGRAALLDLDPRALAVGSSAEADSYVTAGDGFVWHLGPSGTWRVIDADRPIAGVGFGP